VFLHANLGGILRFPIAELCPSASGEVPALFLSRSGLTAVSPRVMSKEPRELYMQPKVHDSASMENIISIYFCLCRAVLPNGYLHHLRQFLTANIPSETRNIVK